MNIKFSVVLLSLVSVCLQISNKANAAVLESSPSHFVIEISTYSEASAEVAYTQFTRVHEWWDGSHSWFGDAENFSLDTSAGGCFCEIEGKRQVQHMTVSFVDPNKEIRMLGGLGPLQMMALRGAMSWRFEANHESGSKITQRYTVLGVPSQNLDKLAPIVDSVQASQQASLMRALSN